MVDPKDVLKPKDYANYRNIRAVSALFVVLGVILVIGGYSIATKKEPDPEMGVAEGIALMVVGAAGVVGGRAVLSGNRRWAWLVKVMAFLYLLAIPIGTILSIVMFAGLSKYLDSMDRIRAAGLENEES